MSEQLTLFHLDSERGFRGGERQLLYLAAHLRYRGHENVIVCRRGEALEKAAAGQGFRVLALPFTLGELDPGCAWRLRAAVRSATGRVLLHAHTAHAAGLASLTRHLGGPKWVAHRRVDFRLNGAVSRRLKYGGAGRIIAVSESIRRILEEDGIPSRRIAVIPDCLPVTKEEAQRASVSGGPLGPAAPQRRATLRRLLADRHGIAADAPLIGNLAALVPHKDQETLIKAAAILLRTHPRVLFVILGDGPLRRSLEELRESLDISGSVLLPGRQPDIRPWLDSLDLYVQSSWGEGMGSVLLEAAACGVPIVATRAGGIPEVVEDGRSALLVPPRDPESLAAALKNALDDPQASRERAAAAASDLPRFSLTELGDAAIRLYEETL